MKEENMKALFLLSGLEIEKSYKLANEYCSDWDDMPWWLVKTEYGMIRIGWRKRVINIDWSDTDYRSGESKFWDGREIDVLTSDNVTKSETNVHAWGYAKAVEYLITLNLRLRQVHYKPDHVVSD